MADKMPMDLDPRLWRKVHNLWISELYQRLKPQVAGRLALGIDQEISLVQLEGSAIHLRPDVHVTEVVPPHGASRTRESARGAIAYAEGIESLSSESRHYLVLKDLGGGDVVGVLEILSPTNKGHYAADGREAFAERRRRLLATPVSYVEVDAVAAGIRWVPQCLSELAGYAGVVWSSLPRDDARIFRGWAWNLEGPLPDIPWDLGPHGIVRLDLDATFRDALRASGQGL